MKAQQVNPQTRKARPKLHYQQQGSTQTLAEGLAEYYRVNKGIIFPMGEMAPESAEFFRRHDMCHVLFGLTTSADDEALVDTRIMMGTTVNSRTYVKSYSSVPEIKQIFQNTGFLVLLLFTLKAVPRMLRVLLTAWRLPKKWPWTPPEDYLSRTLADLRSEYRIRVF